MGTTSQKLTYLNDTKGLLKQKINNLGGDITDETTFRQYVEELEEVYNNLPKTSYSEGTEITLSNTLKGKLDFENDIVGYGDTEQESTTGANLLQVTNQDLINGTTKEGITFKYNNDGSISFNGTSTARYYTCFANIINTNFLTSGTTYYIKANGTNNNIGIYIIYNGSSAGPLVWGNEEKSWTVPEEITGIIIRAVVKESGVVLNNDKIFPIISTTSGATFEKYTGGIPAPNPSYPFPIEVVRGKNIFDKDNAITSGYLVASDGHIGTSSNHVISDYIEIQGGKQYATSGFSNSGSLPSVCFYDSNKTFISGISHNNQNPITYTTPSNAKYLRESLLVADKNTLQIESGSQATSYLPYNTVEIEERGKNYWGGTLYNGQTNGAGVWSSQTSRVTNTSSSTDKSTLKLKAGTYTLSIENLNNAILLTKDENGNILDNFATYWRALPLTFELTQEGYVYFSAKKSDDSNITPSDYFPMIADGTDTTYEPYQEPKTYQLSLGEYEFAKIGNYVDTIEYDVENDKVYKNEAIGKYQFTGNEIFGKSGATNLNGYIFNFSSVTTNMLAPANNTLKANILSNAFITKAVNTIINKATYGIGIRSDKFLYIGTPLGSFENVSELQTYLANNITFMYYALITPVKKEITGTLKDQIKALYNSQSFTGTTIITSNGDLPLVLKVRALKG